MHDFWNDGPIWIDPSVFQRYSGRSWSDNRFTVTTTTSTTTPIAQPLTEEQVRKIVRQEMADLVNPDIPDAPPENL
jgi:hypothetical protein